MAEPIKMPFGRLTHVDPRNHILDESQSLHKKLQFWGGVVQSTAKHWQSLLRCTQQEIIQFNP